MRKVRGPAGAVCCELRVADKQRDPLLADGVVLDCIAVAPGDVNKTLAKKNHTKMVGR